MDQIPSGWRDDRVYAIWVSEVMLEQTGVATVIPYINCWMEVFPTPRGLAAASLDDVNAVWKGLGYYRRAKFLDEGAKEVVSKYGGRLPNSLGGLGMIKGIGEYTAGAIASQAFGIRAPVVDGNVKRVFSRLGAIAVSPSEGKAQASFWWVATDLVSAGDRPGDLNQSIMELGGIICTPKTPSCGQCPISLHCKTLAEVRCNWGNPKTKLGGWIVDLL